MAEEFKYFSVGDLRKVLKDMADDVPVVSAPLNKKVRVALDVDIISDAKLGDYAGNIVIFNTGLFDIANKEIILSTAKADSGSSDLN